ncbi:hypothetical protein [Pseudonocardia spinosispora]|uniref:hypothetical protein n=1 Tax=Pseudonocardia spinosispora TaxID=103441 RepID=UPI00048D968F|nr:hypothetical protein [Pseudonocardia spinosispora]
MFVRLTTVIGHSADVQDAVRFAETVVRPKVEAAPGSRGFTTAVAAGYGRALDAAFWVDADAMNASDELLSTVRSEFVEDGAYSEDYEVLLEVQRTDARPGALLELSRFECPAEVVELLIGADMVSETRTADGLCGVQLMFDPARGRGIVATTWTDDGSARGFWLTGGQLRARAARQVDGLTFVGIDFYSVVAARSLQT